MTVNRIASDEPDEVRILPQPITFWHHGRQYQATVSSSAIGTKRLLAEFGVVYHLKGDFGRAWIADPCSMALQDGLHNARVYEDRKAAADRQARRQAKAALLEEEAAARRTKTARW